jgi:integrase/recombinase XerD
MYLLEATRSLNTYNRRRYTMTPLQQRMIEDLQLRGMSARTQQMYVRAVRQLAQHYGKPPDQINDEELRQYFLYVKNVKHWSRSGTTIALCGLKFFYEHTLQRPLATLQVVRPARERKLPVVLGREEVRQVLSQVRLLRYRTCLTTIYSCGLRLQEGTHLQVSDIDSARSLIHVHRGKGGKDRYVPPRTRPWSCCVSTGRLTAIPSGFSPLRDAAAFIAPPPKGPHPLAMFRMPFA